jgi:hypothetical protein
LLAEQKNADHAGAVMRFVPERLNPRSAMRGLSTRSVAELLVEVGDPRRFTEGGFARFNGSAPLPASTAEGPGEPVRHRYNPG